MPRSRLLQISWRFVSFVLGNSFIAAGCVFAVKNPWGVAAWDVFHLGIAKLTGLRLGTAIAGLGVLFVIVSVLLGGTWTIRIGTLLNTVLVGIFVNFYQGRGIPPDPNGLGWGLLYLLLGTFLLALGTVVYVRTGLGAGPRHGVMLVISQRTGLSFGRVKAIMEVVFALSGWALGGPLGLGTVFIAVTNGAICDLLFRVLGRGFLPDTVQIPIGVGRSEGHTNIEH